MDRSDLYEDEDAPEWNGTTRTLAIIFAVLLVIFIIGFLIGYVIKREKVRTGQKPAPF